VAALQLALAMPLALAIDTTEIPDPALQARYQALTHELRCMQCQNQSIADSPVGLASDLRREVQELLVAGKSDDEVRAWMKDRYGAFILFRPEYSWRNAWLWLSPIVLLLIGAFAALRVVRQRAGMVASDTSDPDADIPAAQASGQSSAATTGGGVGIPGDVKR
jgi:cytochrome c-type biogenesis protein CcmH